MTVMVNAIGPVGSDLYVPTQTARASGRCW